MSITEESIGSSEVKLFQPEFSGASISQEQKGDWLHELWEYGVHIIPCGSPSDIVPQYFRKRHPFDDELELKAKWAKTPRVNWALSKNSAIGHRDHKLASRVPQCQLGSDNRNQLRSH